MALRFFDYEIPVLNALTKLGGSAKTRDVYPVVEEIMAKTLKDHSEEYGHYKLPQDIIWKNKTQWAREYLKQKGQLDGSIRGVWSITTEGKERLRLLKATGRDPDEGRATIEGVDENLPNTEANPADAFDRLGDLQHHGDILGVRGIVYEPINEQGVVLLFAALAHDLNFRIEGIRTGFPDAMLARKQPNGSFRTVMAEFEFKSSNFVQHKHPVDRCDLIICWEHDWKDCPIEVLELKSIAKSYRD